MKKIININFHGTVVPIEETAYEILQQYVESLRRYFANEEGRDEIINDIENRFAELFSESLKKGADCITDADVNTIITSMGRPEDFEEEERAQPSAGTGNNSNSSAGTGFQGQNTAQQQSSYIYSNDEGRRLYRAENNKILGGVCAGLANYLRLDPSVVRLIFILITFGWGAGFLLYIILWIILPAKSLPSNARKRLFRNPDDRVLGGVASGLAAYFHIDVWIPRLIFAMPLILSIMASIFRFGWFNFDGPRFFTGGFGGTLFVIYIILWIVLPEAVTASEKLEMRGEKVDLESIKNTIKSDLENLKGRAKEMGSEVKGRFQEAGEEMKQRTRTFTAEAAPVARKAGSGIGHAIGVLFKVFFLFLAGLIALVLVMVLIGLSFKGDGLLTMKNFILSGFWQNFLAWASFILFLLTPVIALLTWLIRRITGVRSRSHYLGYMFATLWVIGLFCFIGLIGSVLNNFRTRQRVEDVIRLSPPSHGKLLVRADPERSGYMDNDWWFDNDLRNNRLFAQLDDDSIILNTVRLHLLKSPDSDYHVRIVKFSLGNNPRIAKESASQIQFTTRQADSVLYLPHGFVITKAQKFRNQQVLVAVAIPVGKRIRVASNIDDYHWFNIDVNRRNIRWNRGGIDNWDEDNDEDNEWGNSLDWTTNTDYIMTDNGLSRIGNNPRTEETNPERPERPERPEPKEQPERPEHTAPPKPADGYRYKRPVDSVRPHGAKDGSKIKATALAEAESPSSYFLARLFNP